ncbi:MAG: flagellar biosynthesis anti-sigma factor FlgM [Oscillospiraceae bacterium]|jgi:anti-sigma28 factor (negative regulator of flagellin synthesis)|nr:flagellar biosynthesis anti-sigma factor FlgM [Oscillospiraceae bacterium]
MKINPIQNNAIQSYKVGRVTAPGKAGTAGKLDEVSFSAEALSFSRTLAEVREQVEVRTPAETAHFDDVAARVRSGQYSISGSAVAEKIINSIISE